MIVLSGADLVLSDRIQSPGTLILEEDRIIEIVSGARPGGTGVGHLDLHDHIIVPGFIDVHVHGVEGTDTLDSRGAVAKIAAKLPGYGVTAFCPTTVACAPAMLAEVLAGVHDLRREPFAPGARVPGARALGAHLESNFISSEYRGAQPATHLCLPSSGEGQKILDEIQRAAPDVALVTLAPELDGAFDLIGWLVKEGIRVSLGHSGASFERAEAAIDAGARHATHLFNRMPPLSHRDPGLAGAVLTRKEVAAEIICDGVHVHTPMIRLAIAAKGIDRIMAITDGTAASGLPDGSVASLGGRRICVRDGAAYLDEGTLAGSITTMDLVFWFLVKQVGLSLSDASRLCSTTPAAELRLPECGAIARGMLADLVVLDKNLAVKQTYVAGRLAFSDL
jgi:N-acetylglucosamine-6-phosphate deacetylase